MEYVQTVLAQIEASRIDEASRPQGLLDELDQHSSYLAQQPGFRDMRVTRSINPQGNVLLVVETRWRDDASLVQYETNEPNVMSILGKYQDLILPNTLQVLDMEALRSETWRGPAHAAAELQERIALPLLIPLGVLAFALLLIYGLSRVYLEVPAEVATGLAAAIAIGILGIAWYLASNPRISGRQIGTILAAAAAVLLGGAIFAIVHEDGEAESEEPPAAAASPTPGAPAPGGGLELTMGDNFFEFQGQQNPTIQVQAGQQVTINLTNSGSATHNMHIAGVDNTYGIQVCAPGGEEPCSDPPIMGAGDTGSITFLPDQPGSYDFRCDFHPQQMTGIIEIQ